MKGAAIDLSATNNYGTSSASSASTAVTATTVPQAPSISAVAGNHSLSGEHASLLRALEGV